jgi:hypothetical protein
MGRSDEETCLGVRFDEGNKFVFEVGGKPEDLVDKGYEPVGENMLTALCWLHDYIPELPTHRSPDRVSEEEFRQLDGTFVQEGLGQPPKPCSGYDGFHASVPGGGGCCISGVTFLRFARTPEDQALRRTRFSFDWCETKEWADVHTSCPLLALAREGKKPVLFTVYN